MYQTIICITLMGIFSVVGGIALYYEKCKIEILMERGERYAYYQGK